MKRVNPLCNSAETHKKQKVIQDVPDYIQPNLKLVFVGFNPGLRSGKLGHHYAGVTNQFYSLLTESKLVPQKVTFKDDKNLLQYSIGLTNIIDRTSRGSDDLSKEEMKNGAKSLLEKLKLYQPKVVCFNGMGVYEACTGTKRKSKVGLQKQKLDGLDSIVFVVPSSSARVTAYTHGDKLKLFKELKELVDKL